MHEYRYRIVVTGLLGEAGREAFADFTVECDGSATALIACLDQSALHGALHRVQSLGLELVGLTRLPADEN